MIGGRLPARGALRRSSRQRLIDQTEIDQDLMNVLGGHVAGILELKLLPLADDHAQSGRESFLSEAALIGDTAHDLIVLGLEVDHAGDVLVGHIPSWGWNFCL